MKVKVNLLVFIVPLILILLNSCERDITVDLPQTKSKVVVDGYVEIGKPVYIILSRNAPYFAPINASSINSFEAGATVTLNDGFITDTLSEVDSLVGIFYISLKIVGVEGRTYTLNIRTSQNEQLNAVTTLRKAVPLDSVWFKVQESLAGNDSLGYVWAKLKDPDTLNNCYRWLAMRVGKDASFIAPIGSSFEDRFINNTTFNFAYNRGSLLNSSAKDDINEEAGFFKKGDSIIVKWCAVDRPTFEFWRDAETQVSNNGSPFATPSVIRSNVKGGLGLFSAYSPSYYYLRAK